jgi:hypothetical protein
LYGPPLSGRPPATAGGLATIGGTPVTMSLYVENVDDVFTRAIDAGANARRAVENQFYGDRSGQFRGRVRAPVECRHPHRRRIPAGDAPARRRRDERLTTSRWPRQREGNDLTRPAYVHRAEVVATLRSRERTAGPTG